jgi:hypothetical protein
MENENFNQETNLNSESGTQSNFSIPEEYQEKGWARFFDGKEGDELKAELFKSYDSSQGLIGKRVSDYIATTDLTQLDNWGELKEKLTSQIAPEFKTPQDVKEYGLAELLKDENGNEVFSAPEEAIELFSNQFKELGLNVEQAQGLFKEYMKFETEQFQKLTDANELEANINEMFKGDTKQRQTCESLIKEFLPQDDQQFIQDVMPNKVVEMFYKVAKGMADKYGYIEGAAKDNPVTLTRTENEKQSRYDELCSKLTELSSRPHTTDEKQKILDELNKVFA